MAKKQTPQKIAEFKQWAMTKLTAEQIQRARDCPNKYGAATALAKEFGCSVQHISAIRLRRTCSGKPSGRPKLPQGKPDDVYIRIRISQDTLDFLKRYTPMSYGEAVNTIVTFIAQKIEEENKPIT